jgi:hypothetical protein
LLEWKEDDRIKNPAFIIVQLESALECQEGEGKEEIDLTESELLFVKVTLALGTLPAVSKAFPPFQGH